MPGHKSLHAASPIKAGAVIVVFSAVETLPLPHQMTLQVRLYFVEDVLCALKLYVNILHTDLGQASLLKQGSNVCEGNLTAQTTCVDTHTAKF